MTEAVQVDQEYNFDYCPFCNTDLTQGALAYVEKDVTNYIYYKKDPQFGWIEDWEEDGNNPSETFYACKECGKQLPTEYQAHFSENI